MRITTIYEGTSEIMQWTVSRDRWRAHLQDHGQYYKKIAASLEALHREDPNVGADAAALAVNVVQETTERCRVSSRRTPFTLTATTSRSSSGSAGTGASGGGGFGR